MWNLALINLFADPVKVEPVKKRTGRPKKDGKVFKSSAAQLKNLEKYRETKMEETERGKKAIMNHIKQHHKITRQDVMVLWVFGRDKAGQLLERLKRERRIERVPAGNKTYWREMK